jgi:hypothetical protein
VVVELPYMKLWTQRFFGSIRVQGLRGEHRLIYLGLLVAEWGLDGRGLPNDLKELARILGISEDTMIDAWGDGHNRVSQFFEVKHGRLTNDTLEATLKDERAFRRERSESGRRGNEIRWGKQRDKSQSDRSAIASRDGGGDGDEDGDEGQNGVPEKRPGESFKGFDRRVELEAEARREAARLKRQLEEQAERQAPVPDAVAPDEAERLAAEVRAKLREMTRRPNP